MKQQSVMKSPAFVITACLLIASTNIALVNATTKCVDEPNWTTHDSKSSGLWSGKTCSNIADNPSFWCDYLEEYSNEITNQSSKDACCICGGGSTITLTDSSPSQTPSDSPTQCQDEPNFFWNTDNPNKPLGCDLVTEGFCDDLSQIW